MTTLNLSPLPSSRYDSTAIGPMSECDGFVDEQVILALLRGPASHRGPVCMSDLALAADDMDFAGWSLSSRLPARATEVLIRRAAPPVLEEYGIGQPHAGAHRWWLAGVAGVFSTMLISLLLFTLSSRNVQEKNDFSIIEASRKNLHSGKIFGSPQDRSRELTGSPAER